MTPALIAGLVLQYGIPAIDQIVQIVSKWGGAQQVPVAEWQALRKRLELLPEYWDIVDKAG